MSQNINLHANDQKLVVFGLTPWENQKGDSGTTWTRIGRAFINRDGSLQIFLDFAPVRGQALQVRPWEPRDDRGNSSSSSSSSGAPPSGDVPF